MGSSLLKKHWNHGRTYKGWVSLTNTETWNRDISKPKIFTQFLGDSECMGSHCWLKQKRGSPGSMYVEWNKRKVNRVLCVCICVCDKSIRLSSGRRGRIRWPRSLRTEDQQLLFTPPSSSAAACAVLAFAHWLSFPNDFPAFMIYTDSLQWTPFILQNATCTSWEFWGELGGPQPLGIPSIRMLNAWCYNVCSCCPHGLQASWRKELYLIHIVFQSLVLCLQ